MNKILVVFVSLGLVLSPAYSSTYTVRAKDGTVTGYVRQNGSKATYYDKNWTVKNYYKSSSNGQVRQYSKNYQHQKSYR